MSEKDLLNLINDVSIVEVTEKDLVALKNYMNIWTFLTTWKE